MSTLAVCTSKHETAGATAEKLAAAGLRAFQNEAAKRPMYWVRVEPRAYGVADELTLGTD